MTGIEQNNCKICSTQVPDEYLVYSGPDWLIRHSNETNILGYCILQAQRHFLDLSEASPGELAPYGSILGAIMSAQRELLQYDRVYTFSLAEAVPHFHVHVIPKRKEFPRGFKGRGILSYPTSPACDPALVASMVQKLRIQLRRRSIV